MYGVQERKRKETWRILAVYNNGKIKETRKEIKGGIEELKEEILFTRGILMLG